MKVSITGLGLAHEIEVDGMHGLLAALRKAIANPSIRMEQIVIKRYTALIVYKGWNSIVSFDVDGFGHMGFCEDPDLIKNKSADIWDAIVAASQS